MRDIAIYGAGGFGREVACMIKRINAKDPTWNLVGFFDDNQGLWGTCNEYGMVLGGLRELNGWNKELSVVVGIGNPDVVKRIIAGIVNVCVSFPNILDPDVRIMDDGNYTIGKGNVFASGCMISIAVKVGDFNIFNNDTVLGHDASIGDYNSFMPNVNISGGVVIGDGNFFGVKSTVIQYLKVGNGVKLGANSLLMRNAKDGLLYLGVPAKKLDI